LVRKWPDLIGIESLKLQVKENFLYFLSNLCTSVEYAEYLDFVFENTAPDDCYLYFNALTELIKRRRSLLREVFEVLEKHGKHEDTAFHIGYRTVDAAEKSSVETTLERVNAHKICYGDHASPRNLGASPYFKLDEHGKIAAYCIECKEIMR
jgi:hypothetical protein